MGSMFLSNLTTLTSHKRRTQIEKVSARIGGVDLPNSKPIATSLTYIYGIGRVTANEILSTTKLENKRAKELISAELQTLRHEVEKFSIEGSMRRFNSLNLKRLKDIGCY